MTSPIAIPRGVDKAWVEQVIVTEALRGGGTNLRDDVCRTVRQYWSLGGELLAEHDPYPAQEEP